MVGGFFPITYYMSRSVRPYFIQFFAVGYLASYFYVVKPFVTSQFQSSLNKAVRPYKQKYSIKEDSDYLQ